MIKKHEVEKALKHFLKKKVSFVAGLIVSFLITGGIGLASSLQIESERNLIRDDLLSKIEAQKAEVQALLDENEAKLRNLQSNYENLIKQGDYYAKPVYPSSQVFFMSFYENAGKMKDRTKDAFSKEIALMEEYLKKYVSGSVSGLNSELEKAYLSGTLSAGDLAELLLKDGNGVVSVGNPHRIEIDLGVNVTLLEPHIPVISKSVDVQVDVPSVPTISITAPTPNVPTFAAPSVTIPTLGTVSVPVVSLQVTPPEEVTPITVGSVSPSAPSGVTLSAPTVSVSVTPPAVNPTMAQPPIVPDAPSTLEFNVTPTGPGTFAAPSAPAAVATPTPPTAASPNVIVPPNIQYNAFGQTEYMAQAVGGSYGLWMNNNETIAATSAVISIAGASHAGSMTMTSGSIATNVGNIATGTVYTQPSSSTAGTFGPRTVISTTGSSSGYAMPVNVTGNYEVKLNSSDGCTYTFISLNTCWYGVGGLVKLDGNLTLDNSSAASTGVLVGLRLQTNAMVVQSTGAGIQLAAGRTITINGSYGIGGLITTETQQETARTHFTNSGTIIVAGTRNIGIDFGVYDAFYPYVDVNAGTINVTGTNDYAIRVQNMSGYTPYYGTYDYKRYYENIIIQNGTITLSGNNSVGMSFAQKVGNVANVIGSVTGMTIVVGGNNNVGILRDQSYENTHNGDLTVNGTTITTNGLRFASTATNSVLLRTDKFKSILSASITTHGGTSGNTAIQATNGSTAEFTTGYALTVTGPSATFTGMLASGAGSVAVNHGTISITASDSSGLAALSSGTITSDTSVTINGNNSSAIYNAANATISGTISATGTSASGIYNGAAAINLSVTGTTITASGQSASGIYNVATTIILLSGGSIGVTGTVGGSATGIYNSGTINPSGVAITANNYGVGIYNAGTMAVSGGSITASGNASTGVYAKLGNINLNGNISASGTNATGVVYEGGIINSSGFTVTASGSGALGLYNLGTLTTTPAITISNNNGTGIYNAAGKTVTVTDNISSPSAGYTHIAGISNAGTVVNSTAAISIYNGLSTGIYNTGNIAAVNGTITVSGTGASAVSTGIYNRPTGVITNVAGTVTAGAYSTALFNEGTMSVTGIVTASGTAQSTGIYNKGTGSLTLSGTIAINVTGADGTGIYNDSSSNISLTSGTVSVGGSSSAGLYHIGTGIFTLGGTGAVNTTGESSAGIFNIGTGTGEFQMTGGTISVVGANSQGSVGVYNKNTNAKFTLSSGAITATNEKSTGVYNEGTFIINSGSITSTGSSTTGMYNKGIGAIFGINGGTLTTIGIKSSTVYNEMGTINIGASNTIVSNQGATGMYIKGGTINTAVGAVTTINVTNTLISPALGAGEGVGVFASYDGINGSTVNLNNSLITVVGGSSAVASYGIATGIGTTNLILTGATVDYDGSGFAVYSNGEYGKIDLTDAQMNLRGSSTGVEIDYSSGVSPITFFDTDIDIYSPDVTLANLKNYSTPLATSTLAGGIAGALGSGVTVNDYTGGLFTYARIDGGVLSIDADIDKLDTTGPGGRDYYKRFQGQRMSITVENNKTVTAVMSTAQATADYDNQVIALESNSSANAVAPIETEIELLSGAKIIASRTDTSGPGAVGAFINYGNMTIDNGATIEIQQGYNTVTDGVGVFAVNGSTVDNAGTIKVAGGNGIGILSMGYRHSSLGFNDVGAEFGAFALDQGKITINNTGNITLDNNASIGIYAQNNTSSASGLYVAVRLPGDDSVQNTGNITVASGNSATDMSIGIYGSGVTIRNSGNITVGDYGVGIYGIDGSTIDTATTGTLGIIKVGGNSVGIMGNGSTIAATVTSLNLQSDNTTADKIGIMYSNTASNIDFNIDGTSFKKGTIIYLKDPGTVFTYGSAGKLLKVGTNGVGIYLSESVTPATVIATNAGTIDLLSGSIKAVGMYSDGGVLANTGIININDDSGQVGIFASGIDATVDNTGGIINFVADKGTGIYLENGATLTNSGTVSFGTYKEGIGILLDGSTAAVGGLSIASDNINQNILIYAQDKGTNVSTVTNGSTLVVNGQVLPASGSNKTIGVYLKRNTLQNTYTGGTLTVTNGALGIYSSGNNKIANVTVEASGKSTVGVYLDGSSELDTDIIKVTGAITGESVIGVYANGGVVTVTGGLDIETGTSLGSDYATGMYLTNGATVTGATISVENKSSQTNVGLYYSGITTLTQGTDLVLDGTGLVGIYVDGGLTLNNANSITYTVGANKLIGTYVAGDSNYVSTSTTDTIGTSGSAGILVGDGTGTNSGTLTVNNTGSAAMAALAKVTGETAKAVNNTGATINSTSGAGMLIGAITGYLGNSEGENKGAISVSAGAVGIAVNGSKGKFDGTGGTITANGASAVGLYLEETGINQIQTPGTLSLGTADSIGVYANKSKVDFNITLGSGVTTGIGLLARGISTNKTEITGIVDASDSTNTIGVFLEDENVMFNGATIKSGNVGLYIKAMTSYTLENVTVESKISGAVGIYTNAVNLLYKATTTVENGGLGIYVPTGTTLTTDGGIINIDGAASVGIILDGGTGNLGTTGSLTLNFGPSHGMGILVRNGGTLNIGAMLTMTGVGTLAAVENSSLSNSGTLTVNGSTALLGNFTGGGPYILENANTGIINITGGGVGIAALGVAGVATVTARNNGIINVSGKDASNNSSVGIYSTIAEIQNNNVINVGADGIGIYANGTNKDTISNSIVLNGTKAIGIIVGGATTGLTSTSITGSNGTVGIYLDGVIGGNIDAGTITLADDTVGIYANGGTTTVTGDIIIGNKVISSPIGIFAANSANITIGAGTTITAGTNAIAIGADSSTISNVDTTAITVAPGGVQLYVGNGGSIGVVGAGTLDANDSVGLMINGTGSITGVTNIDVSNGGVGAYFISSTASIPTINLYDGVPGTTPVYSIGVYYSGVSGTITLPTINQIGDYTIGAAIDKGSTLTLGNISMTSTTGKNQIGVMSKGTMALSNSITTGTITMGGSDENIGFYGEYTDVTSGNITVGDSTASTDKSTASIGMYLQYGGVAAGAVTAGKNSIGIYANDLNATGITTQDVAVDENGIGIYAVGSGAEDVNVAGNVSVARNGAIGIYGKDVRIDVSGSITVGEGTSIGIVSEGAGDISYAGSITVANKGTSTGSIGIYKKGTSGNITTTANNWTIGDSGYGLYLIEDSGNGTGYLTGINDASMILGESAVGIYESGNVQLINTGDITVGSTYLGPGGDHGDTASHQNSAGIYLTKEAKLINTGIITVEEDHSVGVYVSGENSYFENAVGGVINVDRGGTGILVKRDSTTPALIGGIAVNNGTINIGNNPSISGNDSYGMAAYVGSTIINGTTGVINVYSGVAMYVGNAGYLDNQGTINIYTGAGTGVMGNGNLINGGTINLITGTGTVNDMGTGGPTEEGSIKIDEHGIKINEKYVSVGGRIWADLPIILEGAYVDITNFGDSTVPLFTSPDISGTIHLTPNFATIGNGYAFKVDNFTKALESGGTSKIIIETSPMFIIREVNGSLYVAKKPYVELAAPGIAGLTSESQYKNLYDGLDNLLYADPAGTSKDSIMLKDLNAHLEEIFTERGVQAFNKEVARTLAETRGDIYGTIQTRMRNVQQAFDGAFEELVGSYNTSKDSSKYSVIYGQGKFADDTLGVDEYDYRVQGLMYMKEYEGRNYGNKWGYSIGFGVSRFDFDDAPTYGDKSKEDVYSVRVGIHGVLNFNNEDSFRLISRLELGYNRHEAERSLELEKTHKNKSEYDSYQVSLDSRLEKTIYRSMSSKIDIYAGVKLEYGVINGFSERGEGLEVEVDKNDYFSIQPEVGIKGYRRAYIGKKLSMKLEGSASYGYELGSFYEENEARIKNGSTGTYELIRPEKERGVAKGKIGITIEKANKMGITFDVEVRKQTNKKEADVRYGVSLKYVF